MKRTLTYLAAAGALALAACFPVVASAGHGHGDGHHGHGNGRHGHNDGNGRHDHNGDGDHRNDWAYGRGHGDRDWDDDRGPRFAYSRGYGSGGYPGYGAYAAQDTTIRPTNVSTPGTAGIHAPTITMATRARR
jgi:hypothetical protein